SAQPPDVRGHAADLVCLEADDDQILGPQLGHPVGGAHLERPLGAAFLKPEALLPDRGEVRAPHDDAHLVTERRQLRCDQPADGSGADDADLHLTTRGPASVPGRCAGAYPWLPWGSRSETPPSAEP